ncbi:MAG: hypothetical protein HY959_12145 [Ignavibacteriae bacterium]|nr:hypothetical protein [Ignavibacteriota bacterium]
MYGLNEENIFYNNFEIKFAPQYGIVSLKNSNENITTNLINLWTYPDYHNYSHHLYDCKDYCEKLKIFMNEILTLANNIKKERGDIYSYLCSHFFECLTNYTLSLRKFHLYFNGIIFWDFINTIVLEWEKNNPNFTIHKGSLYCFEAEIYMAVKDVEIAFTFLHRAIGEDYKIKDYIKGYPNSAPAYKIVTLRETIDHFMSNYVDYIRNEIKIGINAFNDIINVSPPLTLEEFDQLLLSNDLFDSDKLYENIKINISYYIWNTSYYLSKTKINNEITQFDNLNILNKLFGMCVVLESLIKILSKKEKLESTKDITKKLYLVVGGDNKTFDKLYDYVKKKDDMIDGLILELLISENHEFKSYSISNEVKCVLIYHIIRNFTAHNIKSVEAIGKNFLEISQRLLFLLFIILRYYKSTLLKAKS